MEIRCVNEILFGILEDGILEVKCRSHRCGYRPGRVILHRFDVKTGALVETKRFKAPTRERNRNGAHDYSAAVRSA